MKLHEVATTPPDKKKSKKWPDKITDKEQIREWLDAHYVNGYSINDDGTVDVLHGMAHTINSKGVNLGVYGDETKTSLINLTHIPIKFRKVVGAFILEDNRHLTSLEGCPDEVTELFAVYDCPKITSLKGAPKKCEAFRTTSTSISNLEHAPSISKEDGDFAITKTKITSLNGCPKIVGQFQCEHNPLVTSWDGRPDIVNGYLHVDHTGINTIEGMVPKVLSGVSFIGTKITSLKNIHKHLEFIESGAIVNINNTEIKDGFLDLLRVKNFGEINTYGVDGDLRKVAKIINKYVEQGNSGIIKAQRELIENDLEDYM